MIVIEWSARAIFLALIILSIWSIAIILERRKFFREQEEALKGVGEKLDEGKLQAIRDWCEKHPDSLAAKYFKFISKNSNPDRVDRASSFFLSGEKKDFEKGIPILATLGSTTPFIGLLGTVLGIIVAFGALSQGQIDSKEIMFVLAEALILTAAGLAVAIPAVIAFNIFNRKVKTIWTQFERIKNFYIDQSEG